MPHRYRCPTIAALVLLSLAASVVAQSIPGLDDKSQAELTRIRGLPPEQQAVAATELVGNFILDQIWPKVTQVNGISTTSPKPRVKGTFSETRQAPFVDGNDLVFPALYYELLYELSFLIGHDVYVAQNFLSVPNSLLNAPYGSSPILPLLEEPVYYLQNEYFAFMRPLITCSSKYPNCVRVQQTALSCSVLFVMGHELAHHFAGHGDRAGDSYPLAEEVFADSRAIALLKAFEPEILVHENDLDPTLLRACYGSPAMNLQFEETTKTGALRDAIHQRKEKLLAALADDIRDDVQGAITPERSNQNVGSLEIVSAAVPEILIIDGTAYPPGNAIGSSLYLPTGRHTIFAAKDGRYAVQSVQVGGGGSPRLNLIYVPMTGPLSEAEIASLRRARDWTGILLATSDGRLHAKAPGLAYTHAEAMNGLKLGEWIDLNDLRDVSAADRRRVESWFRISQPLWSWR